METRTINLIVPRGWHELDKFDSVYMGEFDSEEDFAMPSIGCTRHRSSGLDTLPSLARLFARHIVDECYDIERTMGNLSYYFDYSAFARDLFMCDSIVVTFSKDKSSQTTQKSAADWLPILLFYF